MKTYAPGARVAGRYEVAGRPMVGGMGIVYICNDLEQDRPVALKTFKPEYLPDRVARDRFLREGTTWVDLGAHPHIVRCYQVFQPENILEIYLVLELVARESGHDDASLRSWLTPGRPLPEEMALLFALQVARGMGHAVETIPGFVHRDLKPENVLIGADQLVGTYMNRVRVTDFGLGKVVTESQTVSITDVDKVDPRQVQFTRGAGTPLYMAPEQWRGESVGVYTDVYALGCILYEMLSGRQVAEGYKLEALERAHCEGNRSALLREVPQVARDVVARCLAVEPSARYADWGNVEATLMATYKRVSGRDAPVAGDAAALSREEHVAAGWSYNAIGISYLAIGKAATAMKYFRRACKVSRLEKDQTLEGASLGNLGNAHLDMGNIKRAIRFYRQCLAVHCENRDRYGESMTLINLGNAYHNLGDEHFAVQYYEQAKEIGLRIGDQSREAVVLNNLGSVYLRLGDMQRAVKCFERRLETAQESQDQHGRIVALANLGGVYADLGDVHHAILFYEQAIEVSREIGDRRAEGMALDDLGNCYVDLGDLYRAVQCHEQALEIARETMNQKGEGSALGNLGIVHRRLGHTQQAMQYYEEGLALFRKIGDQNGEAASLDNLGNIWLQLGYAKWAIDYYEQALCIWRDIGAKRGEGNVINNLGNAYLQLGDTKRAIECYRESLRISQKMNDVLRVAKHRANLALAIARSDRANEAIPLLEQSIRDFQQAGYPQFAHQTEQMLAQLRGANEHHG